MSVELPLDLIHRRGADMLAELEPLFAAGNYHLTFIARNSDNPEAHVMLSGEANNLPAVAMALLVLSDPDSRRQLGDGEIPGAEDVAEGDEDEELTMLDILNLTAEVVEEEGMHAPSLWAGINLAADMIQKGVPAEDFLGAALMYRNLAKQKMGGN